MSTKQPQTQDGTDLPSPLRQDSTQHTLLCLDAEGYHHVYVEDRNRVVVINENGIDHVEDLDQYDDKDVDHWVDYVRTERGIKKLQYWTFGTLFGEGWL